MLAEDAWRGLHTVGVRDCLDAINGIGHAAVATDPTFRETLAGHGLTLDPDTGEIAQLASFVGPFSARAAQIGRNLDRYETDWRAARPGREPGPVLRRAWDARAWAEGRPDKIVPRDGSELRRRWVGELHALGYRDNQQPARVQAVPVGHLDRNQAVQEVLSRLAARRSGWNGADIRGEVEQLIARRNIVTDAPVRGELAEHLTARTVAECVPLTGRPGLPEHIRTLSSRHVLDVEADLTARLAARASAAANAPAVAPEQAHDDAPADLDAAQREVVAALASESQLLVVEGAAGAGKTTTLAAARVAVEAQGGRLMVVTPTLKAANVAAQQLGSCASSAAALAYQHGFRWGQDGSWTRLAAGSIDPHIGVVHTGPSQHARLRAGDLLLVDEAAMLDQDTARALLTIADECRARVALVGDRHQLPAIGRGGVLDLAARWADPQACLTLDNVHRFVRTITAADGAVLSVADEQYAQLSLAMRTGADPGAVFDTLLSRDQIRIHHSDAERVAALADAAVAALANRSPAAVVADTREQVTQLNAAIRERLVAAGRVDDAHAAITNAGQRIGVGDRVATRRNNRQLDVANRDLWAITHVTRDGQVAITGQHGDRTLPADYVRDHLELAYASTVHGAQGDTTTLAHMSVTEHTGAASAYVGMTRGRQANTAHLIADSVEQAREQWIAVFGRDRADLGPAHAAELAAQEAARYAQSRPIGQVLADLHRAWTVEQDCVERLARSVPARDHLVELVALRRAQSEQLAPLLERYEHAQHSHTDAKARIEHSQACIAGQAEQLSERLDGQWNRQREQAREQARIVLAGSGRLGLKRAAVNQARDELTGWSHTWQPVLPDMPTNTQHIAYYANRYDYQPHLQAAFERYARAQAEQAHPEHRDLLNAVNASAREREQAWDAVSETRAAHRRQRSRHGRLADIDNPDQRIGQLEHGITSTQDQLTAANDRLAQLAAEPAIRSRPGDFLATEHQNWKANRDSERDAAQRAAATRAALDADAAARERMRHAEQHTLYHAPQTDHGPSIGR
ncbi:MAG: AAA family ATPase [Jatrophihabitantaceae bacterium]